MSRFFLLFFLVGCKFFDYQGDFHICDTGIFDTAPVVANLTDAELECSESFNQCLDDNNICKPKIGVYSFMRTRRIDAKDSKSYNLLKKCRSKYYDCIDPDRSSQHLKKFRRES